MNLELVTYSTKPVNLGEHILCQRAGKGDFEAMASYILARTNLTSEQIIELDDDEVLAVINKIGEAVVSSIVLQQISKAIDAS